MTFLHYKCCLGAAVRYLLLRAAGVGFMIPLGNLFAFVMEGIDRSGLVRSTINQTLV